MLCDLRFALRLLLKERALTALAVLVLTLGIGGVATQLSVINGLMRRPAAFPHAEQLVDVNLVDTSRNQPVGGATVTAAGRVRRPGRGRTVSRSRR